MKEYRWLITAAGLIGFAVAVWFAWVVVRGELDESPKNTPAGQSLVSRPCYYRAVGDVSIECYWFRTREGFSLPIAIFKPHRKLVETPLVYFAGGPGGSRNTGDQALEFWNYWYNYTIPDRDFILFDYRGAEKGRPTWDCHQYTEMSRRGMLLSLDVRAGYDRTGPVLKHCLEEWDLYLRNQLSGQYQPGDTARLFSSIHNARDAIGIVNALGYPTWHALGASYGTRAALVAATMDSGLKKLILDAPYPPGFGNVVDGTRVWLEGLERFWKGCSVGKLCESSDSIVHPEVLFWQAMDQLASEPVSVTVDNWHASGSVKILVDDVRLLLAISGALYSRESRALIVPTLNSLVNADQPPDPILFEELFNYAFDPDFNSMLYFATECNDNELLDESRFKAVLQRAGRLEKYLQWDWQFDICRSDMFTPDSLPPLAPLPVQALVVSGEYDPVTPPEYGSRLMEYLPNGVHIELPRGAHAEFIHGDCGSDVIARFLDESLDASLESVSGGRIKDAFDTCFKQNLSP